MVDIADINIEMSRKLLIVANNSYLVDIAVHFVTFMVEGVLFKVSKCNWYSQRIRFSWHILLEKDFLYKLLSMQSHLPQHTGILPSLHSNSHFFETILWFLHFRLHLFARQHDINFFVFISMLRYNDSRTLAFLLEFKYLIFRLTWFCENDIFILVEDGFVQETSPGRFDCEFSLVDGHQVRDIAEVFVALVQQSFPQLWAQLQHNYIN